MSRGPTIGLTCPGCSWCQSLLTWTAGTWRCLCCRATDAGAPGGRRGRASASDSVEVHFHMAAVTEGRSCCSTWGWEHWATWRGRQNVLYPPACTERRLGLTRRCLKIERNGVKSSEACKTCSVSLLASFLFAERGSRKFHDEGVHISHVGTCLHSEVHTLQTKPLLGTHAIT